MDLLVLTAAANTLPKEDFPIRLLQSISDINANLVELGSEVLLILDINNQKGLLMPTRVWEEVIKDMAARNEVGAKKYNRYLQTDCPDNMLQHAYEEALDLAVYLKTEILKASANKITTRDEAYEMTNNFDRKN